MDLTNVASGIQTAQIGSQIDVAVVKKVLDNQKFQGQAAIQLLQQASQTGQGDPLVAAATGLGGNLDVRG